MRLKKIISSILTFIILLTIITMPVNNDYITNWKSLYLVEAYEISDIMNYGADLSYYKVDDDGNGVYDYIAISDCNKSVESIEIPSEIDKLPVREIRSAFYDCDKLTKITIPESVTSIASFAFYRCKNLESIIIPDSVTDIGDAVFYMCENLKKVKLSSNINSLPSSIGQGLNYGNNKGFFEGCSSLESITIPDKSEAIEANAFKGCSSLTSIILPENIDYIADYAFFDCSSLRSVIKGFIIAYLAVNIINNSHTLFCFKNIYIRHNFLHFAARSVSVFAAIKSFPFDRSSLRREASPFEDCTLCAIP